MVIKSASQKQLHAYQVLHFGDQCPWRLWMIEQAKEAALKTGGEWQAIDLYDRPEIAAQQRVFFPFVTLINGVIRVPSPMSASRLVQIAAENKPMVPFTVQPPAPEGRAERVVPLTSDTITGTCHLCIPADQLAGCRAKQAWAKNISAKAPQGILGFAACHGDEMVGVVEYLPSMVIPYPLPEKDPSMAFITCIYSSEDPGEPLDYRRQVLETLLEFLPRQGFRKVQVIAGQHTAYPNGPASFFISHGFKEMTIIDTITIADGQETLLLLERIF